MTHQQGNVLNAFAQVRQLERQHIDAVKQVFAEAILLDLALQVAVRGCDDPDIDPAFEGAADPAKVSRLPETRNSFGCSEPGSSPISSMNSVPPSATSNRPGLVPIAP